MKNKIVAIVGMCGAGKSEVSNIFKDKGLIRIRFGDITDDFLKKKNLKRNEKNERKIREELRKKYGMAAYAYLNLKRIQESLKKTSVILDGLYSWEEYLLLKKKFGNKLLVIAVHATPGIRYLRLSRRKERPLSFKDSKERDKSEIENINKAGPIVMADYILFNERKSLPKLRKEANRLWNVIKKS